jgi:hypothetical protein
MTFARDTFLTALNDPDMEERIRHQEPRDLDEACRMAQRFEVIRNAVQNTSVDQRAHRARQTRETSDEAEDRQWSESNRGRERSPRYDHRKRWSDNRSTKAGKQQEVATGQPTQASSEQLDLMKDLMKQCVEKDRVTAQLQQEKEELQRALGRKDKPRPQTEARSTKAAEGNNGTRAKQADVLENLLKRAVDAEVKAQGL